MIDFTFNLGSPNFSEIARACGTWDNDLEECFEIKIFMGNLKKDIANWDELISGIEALYVCELICTRCVDWFKGRPYPLCEKIETDYEGVGDCPIMDIVVNKLKIDYKLNMESVRDVLL